MAHLKLGAIFEFYNHVANRAAAAIDVFEADNVRVNDFGQVVAAEPGLDADASAARSRMVKEGQPSGKTTYLVILYRTHTCLARAAAKGIIPMTVRMDTPGRMSSVHDGGPSKKSVSGSSRSFASRGALGAAESS